MTIREIKNQIELAKTQLELLRMFEKQLIQQHGRRIFEEYLNASLDKLNDYSNLLKKKLKDDNDDL